MKNEIDLWHGDCLNLMQDIPDGSVDAIITDPPYGTTACKWDSIIPLEPMWKQLNRIIKANGAIVMTSSQPFTSILVNSNLEFFRYCWVWDKYSSGNFQLANKQPLKIHEDVIVFSKGKCPYNKQMVVSKRYKRKGSKQGLIHFGSEIKYDYDSELRNPTTILCFKKDGLIGSNEERRKRCFHPTQKPVALMEYLIKTYTNENETVLDFTMGSGTTGVACVNLNRNFIGIELDETYFKVAQDRISAA